MKRREFLGVATSFTLAGCLEADNCSTDDTFRIYDSALDGPEYLEFETEDGSIEISVLEIYESEKAEIDINDKNAIGIEENNTYDIDGLEVRVNNVVYNEEVGENTGFIEFTTDEKVRYC